MASSTNTIFRHGSTTFFYSSLFFPPNIYQDVAILYSFVRTADNFVDQIPQDAKGFSRFVHQYRQARKGKRSTNTIISDFIQLEKKASFDPRWTDSFLQAMEQDLIKTEYKTIQETCAYMYGSANVIGLYLCALLDLPKKSFRYAQLLGRAFQFINFIRDIPEDIGLGRQYLPTTELRTYGLANLSLDEVNQKPTQFIRFMRAQIELYQHWRRSAEPGFSYLPPKVRIAIITATKMYDWTANRIYDDPFIVYKRKVKPGVLRIIWQGIVTSVRTIFRFT